MIMSLGTISSILMTGVAGHGYLNSHTDLLSKLMYLSFGSSLVVNSLVTVRGQIMLFSSETHTY